MAELILAEKSVAFAERSGGIYNDDEVYSDTPIELVVGEIYTLVWDGTPYMCIAEATNFDGIDAVEIGNGNIVGIEDDTEEPFVMGYAAEHQMNLIYTLSDAESHTIAIYKGALEEDEPIEPEVVAPEEVNLSLYDRNGNTIIYSGIKTVTFNTDVEGTTVTFSLGTAPDETTVVLDLKEGDQVVQNTETGLIKKAIIQKPEGLAPENIKKGVEIAGVEGTMIGTGVSKEVELNDLDLSGGSDSIVADPETLMSEVVITAPDGLLPENIVEGVEIAGVVGNASLGGDFDATDENLKYFAYHLDSDNKQITIREFSYNRKYSETGDADNIYVPDSLGGYSTVIDTEFCDQRTSSALAGGFFTNNQVTNVNIGGNVAYANGNMAKLFYNSPNFNSPITIPNGVTNLASTFYSCTRFNQPIEIPNGVTNMAETFASCSVFNQPIEIPNGVTNMYRTFFSCSVFNQPIEIPNGVTSLYYAFYGTALDQPLVIPTSVNNIGYCLSGKYGSARTYGSDIMIYAKNITNCKNFLGTRNNSLRTNIYIPAGSATETLFRNTNASYSISGAAITWANNASNNCFYNSTAKIYIYNTL